MSPGTKDDARPDRRSQRSRRRERGADRSTSSGHPVPETPDVEAPPLQESPAPLTNRGIDRGVVIGDGFKVLAQWSGRFILIAIATAILLWLLAQVWVGVLPVLLALIVTTVLWPPVAWLRSKGWPPALAAATVLLSAFLVFIGVFAALAPSVISQSQEIFEQAQEGLDTVLEWLAGPPMNLDAGQLEAAVDQVVSWAQGSAGEIASGVFAGLTVVGSMVVTTLMMLVLTFFFLKDGSRFLPWVRSVSGRSAGRHLTEVLTRMWRTLGGFIRVQAIVSAVDAFFIGLGLVILQVPLALALAVLTFFAGFVPIVGAVTAGGLAVLVALVSLGWQQALIVLAIVIAVQQLEGNLLQPVLQGRSMELHAGIILLAVTGGGTLFGIPGAFLAVPIAATLVVGLRYISEQTDLRAGDLTAADVAVATPEGALVTAAGERAAKDVADRERTHRNVARARQLSVDTADSTRPPGRIRRWLRRLFGRR